VLTDADVLGILDCLRDLLTLRLDIFGRFLAQLLPQTLRRCLLLEALSLFAPFDSAPLAELPRRDTVGLRRLGFQGCPWQDVFWVTLTQYMAFSKDNQRSNVANVASATQTQD
jgi:hypothetical protein